MFWILFDCLCFFSLINFSLWKILAFYDVGIAATRKMELMLLKLMTLLVYGKLTELIIWKNVAFYDASVICDLIVLML